MAASTPSPSHGAVSREASPMPGSAAAAAVAGGGLAPGAARAPAPIRAPEEGAGVGGVVTVPGATSVPTGRAFAPYLNAQSYTAAWGRHEESNPYISVSR